MWLTDKALTKENWGNGAVLEHCFIYIEIKLILSKLDFFFLKMFFIYLTEKVREHKQEQQREREKQAPHWARCLIRGLIPGLWDHDLSQRQMPNNWATQTPQACHFSEPQPLAHGSPRYPTNVVPV